MSSSTSLDVNFYPVYAQTGVVLDGLVLAPSGAMDYAAILKISHSNGVTGIGISVANGHEASVDINVCSNVMLSGDFGTPGSYGDQVITIKGGSENISIAGVIHSNGGRARVQIGQWSDQSMALSDGIVLDLVTEEGKPVDVEIGRATNVTLRGACVRATWYKDWGLVAYWWLKRIVRAVMRIPLNVKGPSWL